MSQDKPRKYQNVFCGKLSATPFLLKIALVLFLFVSPKMLAQTSVKRIYTDWKGYWTSDKATALGNQPNTENNLLAFLWNGKTYSTGANNAALTANSVVFEDSKFRALKIQSLGYDVNTYYLQGSMIDGSLTDRILTPAISGTLSTPAELASRLTDGIRGLALGTGIANIKAGTSSEFKVGTNNVQLGAINDGIPDIVVTQVAEPNSIVDKFKFVDAAGNIVGNEVSVAFNTIQVVGTYRLDLFNSNNGTIATGFTANDTREIRLLAMDFSSFGITTANAAQIDRFVVSFSGSSDCAFIAVNANSLKTGELSLVKKASMPGCGKLGDKITYTFEVTNTGEIPLTNVSIVDPLPGVVITGNSIASLAPNQKVTLIGTYTITADDVVAGTVTNSAIASGMDPSFNIVKDISGQTNNDDIATVINLLPPPIIGAITNLGCSAGGTVVLNSLPSTGNWIIEKKLGNTLTTSTGSGTTTTITGLAVGTYTFRVTNDFGCKSPPTANVVVTNQSSTTWNGTAWSNGNPDATKNVIIADVTNSPFTADLTACALTINAGVTATVPAGITLTIVNAVTTNGQLIFENNASLVQVNDAAVNTGKIEYRRISKPMNNFDFTYWGSPVSGQILFDLSPNTFYDKYWKFENDKWATIMNGAGVMQAARGYAIRVPKPLAAYPNGESVPAAPYAQPVAFKGIPNNGIINLPLQTANSYNLIGNPYPSALDADKFINENLTRLDGTLYFWTHHTAISNNAYAGISDYAVYNKFGSIEAYPGGGKPNGKIASGQAFFMMSTGSGNAVFKNSMRIATANSNAQFFRGTKSKTAASETDKSRVWLDLTNKDGLFKQMLVGYVGDATNELDAGYDGESFDGNKYIDFYSVNNAQNLTIQARSAPFIATDEVPLGYKTIIEGTFTISLNEADGVLKNRSIFIEDKTTKIIHNLKNGPYSFTTVKGTFNDRFLLVYVDKSAVFPPVVIEPPVVEPPVVVVPPAVVTPPAVEPPIVVVPPVIVTPPVEEIPVVEIPSAVVTPPVNESSEVIIPPVVVTPPTEELPVIVVPPIVVKPPVEESPVIVAPPVSVTPPIQESPVVVVPPIVVVPPLVVTPPADAPPIVVLDPTLESPDITVKGRPLVVSVSNHQIKINSFDEIIANVMVYDLRGRLLYEKNSINANEFMIHDLNSTDQFLIVITQLLNGKWVTKEIVFRN